MDDGNTVGGCNLFGRFPTFFKSKKEGWCKHKWQCERDVFAINLVPTNLFVAILVGSNRAQNARRQKIFSACG
jgi:hypothetical protein